MNQEIGLIVIGLILPPLIDLVNRFVKVEKLRFLVAVIFSLVAGGILAYLQYGFDQILANGSLIFISSQMIYKLWYEKSGLQNVVRG
jgi:hypothetical protein